MSRSTEAGRLAIYRQVMVLNNISNNSLKNEISHVESDLKYRLRELEYEKKVFAKAHLAPEMKMKKRKKRRRSSSRSVDMDQLLRRLENHRLTDNWVTKSAGYNSSRVHADDISAPETSHIKNSRDRPEREVDHSASSEARRWRDGRFNIVVSDTTELGPSTELSLPSVKAPRTGSATSRRTSDTFVTEQRGRADEVSVDFIEDSEGMLGKVVDDFPDTDNNIDRLYVDMSARHRSVSLPTISKHSNMILNQNGMHTHRSKSIGDTAMAFQSQVPSGYNWVQAGKMRSSAGVTMGKVIRDLSHGILYRDLDDRQSNMVSDVEWSRLKACRYLRHRKSTPGEPLIE